MKTISHSEVLHYDPSHPCCESSDSADLFPDLLRLEHNKENRGRVASIFIESIGIGVQSRRLTMNEAAWSECVKHLNFRACYDLSLAKLALQQSMLAH
jgi:hypothetical protein